MSEPLLKVDSLCVDIGGMPIVRNASFEVVRGEVLGLIGASGSGKSMTALALMRLLPGGASARGGVWLDGEPLSTKSSEQMRALRGRDIGMVFQDPMNALNPLMRIGDQISETVRLHRQTTRALARRLASDALETVGLGGGEGAMERLPYELSGGQRQRVAIAMAVVLSPSLLIADEPTTALDVITQAQVLTLLQELVRSRRMGLILVSHDLAVVRQLTQRLAVMDDGQIIERGDTETVLRQPREDYTRALVAAATIGTKPRRRDPISGGVVLSAEGIVKEYPRRRRSLFHAAPPLRAVDGVSLAVNAGEAVCLVGESGSGKSSLLSVILGLKSAQQGSVQLCGETFPGLGGSNLRRQRRSIQAVFQDPVGSFDKRWSVDRIIAEPFHLMDVTPTGPERRRRICEVLDQVGLAASDAQRLPREFSGGQRQRIAIARALITRPALIVFDEAFSAIDSLVRNQILQLLADLADGENLAYLFVTHDLRVARAMADRIYVMQQGRIVEEGSTEAIFASPSNRYTQALIAAAPVLGGE